MVISYVFWIAAAILFYTYFGYGILLFLITRFSPRKNSDAINRAAKDLPAVTLVIAAYNEEKFIREKVKNCQSLDYPPDKLLMYFVTDGSTDRTPEILKGYREVKLFHQGERRGKIHAVNRVMEFVTTPVTVYSDANTYLNEAALKKIVRHYEDPTVGGVAGEKRIYSDSEDSASVAGEGLYWKYESFLKKMDARLYSVVGAAGELFSIRTSLFERIDEGMIIEDFVQSMRITARGFRFAYEPDAYACETASVSVEEEWKRKVRIAAGAFQAMVHLSYLLNPFRFGILTFQYVSHRVLRWSLAPLSLLLLLVANLILANRGMSEYQLLLFLQILFYAFAFVGFLARSRSIKAKGFFIPFYFVVMNAAVFAGLYRFVKGKQKVTWERAERAELKLKD